MSHLHVGLVYGGLSSEHEISIRSARNVLRALSGLHRVTPIYIDREGRWHVGGQGSTLPSDPSEMRPLLAAPMHVGCTLLADGESLDALDLDVVFPILHGQNGEDGRIQGFLQTLGLPFVGPDTLASAVCMDKDVAKRLLAAEGLPVTPSVTLRKGHGADYATLTERLGSPLFVKPSNSGSSVGVSKVEREDELEPALTLAFGYDRKVLIETAISGREIECAVLGNETPEASQPGEIVSTAQFYTYDAKYEDPDASRMEVPADLPPDVTEHIRRLALRAFVALGCEGLARVDVFYTDDGEVLINEINTIPGFTDKSMYPVMWEHSGLGNDALADRLVRLALARHERDRSIKTTR